MKITLENADRLDRAIANTLNQSRTLVAQWIKDGRVTVNGAVAKGSLAVEPADDIWLEDAEVVEAVVAEPAEIPVVPIIFEDDHLAVIYKEPGITVHPGLAVEGPTLVDSLLKQFKSLSTVGGDFRPGIVHRLDKMTEGLMIIAKTDEAHLGLKQLFQDHQITKHYYAMVYGDVAGDYFEIEKAIGRSRKNRYMMAVITDPAFSSKAAVTLIEVLKRYGTKTLVRATPRTGRTHQIRVHLSYLNYPIVGDHLYGRKKRRPSDTDERGQLLQAYYLRFVHPITQEVVEIERPLSDRITARG